MRTGSASTVSSGSEDSGVIIISGAEELSEREEELSEEENSASEPITGVFSENSHPEEDIMIAESIRAVKSFFAFVTGFLRENL